MNVRSIFVVLLVLMTPALLAAPRVEGRYVLPDRPVWAGEVFELCVQWRVDRDAFRALSGELVWNVEPLAADAWSKPVLTDAESLSIVTFNRVVMAPRAGRLDLPAASLGFLVQTGTVSNGDYTRAILEPLQARSRAETLTVRALPPAPRNFRGAVGKFELGATLDRAEVRTGEVITWTLSLSGRGNWPMLAALPTRTLLPGLQLRDTVREDVNINGEFERTRRESLTFIVTEPGTYRLPRVEMSIFDPASGQYVTIESPALQIEARGAASSTEQIADDLLDDRVDVVRPLNGSRLAISPLASEALDRWLLIGLLMVLSLWVSLATFRAWQLDPERPVRRAHRRLRRFTRRLVSVDSVALLDITHMRELRQWQLALAERYAVSGRAPTSADFVGREPWYSLWVESDSALYGPTPKLPSDWTLRASRALSELSAPPSFDWRRLSEGHCWWPRTLALVLLIGATALFPSEALRAETAVDSAFERVEREPLDVIARHNLALVLEAEGRLPEAAVHSGIAWLQEPRFEPGAELWTRLRSQGGLVSAAEGGLPESVGVMGRVSSALPASLWQRLYWATAFATVLLALLLLLSRYLPRLRPIWRSTAFALAVATTSMGATWVVTSSYGELLDADAVVVHRQSILREIPVENRLDEGNWVLPGAVGIVERRFLSWVLLRLPDDRGGWVREDAVIAIWASK